MVSSLSLEPNLQNILNILCEEWYYLHNGTLLRTKYGTGIFCFLKFVQQKNTDNQREKLEYKLDNPEASLRDIASHFGVSLSTIRDVFDAIRKKYFTFFKIDTTQNA